MTMFRVGPAGIPASLKSDMDAVLNKKFSTSTTYPPADWPDTINLMGPLPERTVSGSIAHIEDGASEVPIKNWLVTLPASLTGYSAIVGTKINSDNLFLLPENDFSVNSVDFKVQNNALIIDGTVSGGSNISSKNQSFKDYFSFGLPAGTYYFTRGTWNKATYVYKLSDDTNALVTNSGSFTLSEYTVIYIGFYISLNTSIDNVTFDGYIKQGSTASSYSPPTQPTQYTASLGRTIYGGTADIVTGEGVETHKGYTLDNLTWSGGIIGGNWVWYTDLSADGLKLPANSEIFSGICDNYTPIRYNGVSSNTNTIALRSNGYLYINNGSSETEPTGKVTIELDTQTDFTFTPITPTPETENVCNFWADGDSEVTYRADIDLLLNNL